MRPIFKKFISVIAVAVLTIVFIATPTFAVTNPDSMGFGGYSSNVIRVFRNLVESGDSLFTFHYAIPYDSDNYPVETAAETIVFRLYDDAGNLTATFEPYVYPYFGTNGYGDGIASIYFDADDIAPTWGSAAVLTIDGWPVYFTGLSAFSYTLTADDYTAATSQEDNQDELKELVLLWCDRLDSIYEETGVILKTSSDAGMVLSSYGESYFTGAIEGLQAICPDLFFIQVYVPEVMDSTYNMTMADTFATHISGTDWEDGFDVMGQGLGVDGSVMAGLLFTVLCIGISVVCVKKGWGIEAGGAASAFIGIAAAVIMGDIIFAVIMIGSLVAVMGIVWLLMLRRVG